jgi:methyl-accepting chemotaxis protein
MNRFKTFQKKYLIFFGYFVIFLIVLNFIQVVVLPKQANSVNGSFLLFSQCLLLAGSFIVLLLSLRYKRVLDKLYLFSKEIETNTKKYVFNDNKDVDFEDDDLIRNRLLNSLKKATDFIQQVTKGNYDIQWDEMDASNIEFNKENIAGELINMRNKMIEVKEQERIRRWTSEGLSEFSEVIRKNQDNFEHLLDIIIATTVKYIGAQVGGLFILNENEETLSLKACFGFNRKKYINKEVLLGEGLVGQAYLESQTIYLKEIPKGYLSISSGLGESMPTSLIIVPLKVNDKVEGVLELASFKELQQYEIEFLEKMGETLASSIVNLNTSVKTRHLLQMSQEQTEMMRAQEEEMRQNMEEIEATQEQMARNMEELNEVKRSLEEEKYLFNALMDHLPDCIYYKDKESKLIRVSQFMASTFGTDEKELIGKSDFDFQDAEHAQEAYDDEQNIMKTRKPKIDYIEKETREDGTEIWVSTTKMPLLNHKGEVVGTFGISRDVSTLKRLEQQVLFKDTKLKNDEDAYKQKINELNEELNKRNQ